MIFHSYVNVYQWVTIYNSVYKKILSIESRFFPRVHPQQELTRSTTPGLIKQASTYKVSGCWPMYLKSVGQTFGPTIKYLAYLLLFHPDLEKMLGDLRRLKKVSQVTVPPMDLAMPGRLGCCTWWVTLKTQFLEVSSNGATPKWMVHNGTSESSTPMA